MAFEVKYMAPKSPLALTVLFLTVAVITLQIVSLCTNNWANVSNVPATNDFGIPYLGSLRIDVFSNMEIIATSTDGSTSLQRAYGRPCSSNDFGKNCSRIKVTYAFTIISVSLFALTFLAILLVGKRAVTAGLLLAAASFGMIGWAVWSGYVQKDMSNEFVTSTFLYTGPSLTINIGFSQALAIAAWTIGYAAAVLTLVDSSSWRVGSV